jgi:predicted small integral membrane protein
MLDARPESKCPDSAIRRPAIFALVQGVTVIEKRELPATSLHKHETVVDLASGLLRASYYDAFAQRDLR